MQASELRELAARIEAHADLHRDTTPRDPEQEQWERDLRETAAYVRACADVMDAGPIAVIHRNEAGQIYMQDADCNAFDMSKHIGAKLYPVAMPALQLPEPMTDGALNKASSRLRDDLLDHIYEYTTMSEGILPMMLALCRAIEAETLRRMKEANE